MLFRQVKLAKRTTRGQDVNLTCHACLKDFRGRLTRAMAEGPVDLEFGWPGDYGDPHRALRIRVQSARAGGVWLFIQRD